MFAGNNALTGGKLFNSNGLRRYAWGKKWLKEKNFKFERRVRDHKPGGLGPFQWFPKFFFRGPLSNFYRCPPAATLTPFS